MKVCTKCKKTKKEEEFYFKNRKERQEADRKNCGLYGWNCGYFRCRGGGADRRILWCKR